MLFSVCIPTFNRLEDLKVCFRSVCAAVSLFDEPTEVLISDNQSEDGTGDWLRSLAADSANIILRTWTNPANVGAVENVYLLAERSGGDYLVYLADDDIMFPNTLRVAKNSIDAYGALFLKLTAITYYVNSKFTRYDGPMSDIVDTGQPRKFAEIMNFTHMLSGCVIRNTPSTIQKSRLTRNAYPSMRFCAMNAGNAALIAEPMIFHVYENTVFWEHDVDVSTKDRQERQLNRDAQMAFLDTPEGYLDQQTIDLLYARWLRRSSAIEPEVIERFGPISEKVTNLVRKEKNRSQRKLLLKRIRRYIREVFGHHKGAQ